jgi:hypothetical protein
LLQILINLSIDVFNESLPPVFMVLVSGT